MANLACCTMPSLLAFDKFKSCAIKDSMYCSKEMLVFYDREMVVVRLGGVFTKATVLSLLTVSPNPALSKSTIQSLTTAGVHIPLSLEDVDARRLLTVHTGPGKLRILSDRLSLDLSSSANKIWKE